MPLIQLRPHHWKSKLEKKKKHEANLKFIETNSV